MTNGMARRTGPGLLDETHRSPVAAHRPAPGHRGEAGFSVAEVIASVAVITIALVSLSLLIPVSTFAVQQGKQQSTATFLAEQKLEQVRNLPWATSPLNDCLGISISATAAPAVPAGESCALGATTVAAGSPLPWLADEAAVAGFATYSRETRVTDCGVGLGCGGIVNSGMRMVMVTVSYTPLTASGLAPTPQRVSLRMLVAQR